jgi:serine/threonine protein kinase
MPDGTLRLSDFGTARNLSDANSALLAGYQAPPGDLAYAAPEMIACLHDVDPSYAIVGDIYSLGAILFELFACIPLVLNLFDNTTLAILQKTMSTVDRGSRVRMYDAFVTNMADARPLPHLAHFVGTMPAQVLSPINRLYQHMAAINYRTRLTDFNKIFSLINTCMWVLRHEDAYDRQRVFRARIQESKEKKRLELETKREFAKGRSV